MDISERQAKLNTEVRFHNYSQALPLAYALRLELELLSNPSEKQLEQLKTVQLRVRQLEVLTRPVYAKLARKLYHWWVAPDLEEASLPSLRDEEDTPGSRPAEEDE